MKRLSILISCSLWLFGAGCSNGSDTPPEPGPSAAERFEEFVGANLTCGSDADCAIVGDCGPNADFRAVRVDAAEDAYSLMGMRGVGTWDGPEYVAVCGTDNRCAAERSGYFCGGYGGPARPLDPGTTGDDAETDGGM